MRCLEAAWTSSGAWGSFIEVMRQVLFSHPETKKPPSKSLQPSWLELPGICTQIAGGDPKDAGGIAAAWGLIYLAAHIMDAIEDGDPLTSCLADCGSSEAINLATGLYATSGLIFSNMLREGIPIIIINDIRDIFNRTILEMCSGQHFELMSQELTLDDYWRIAQAKSGAFFALSCQSGARMGTDNPSILSGFHDFGLNLGILIQIADDSKDIWGEAEWANMPLKKGHCNLPILYAMSVCSTEENAQIRGILYSSQENPGSIEKIRKILESSGAPIYIATKVEQHRRQAKLALEKTGLNLPADNKLINILGQVSLFIE